MTFKVHAREKFYFTLMCVVSALCYMGLLRAFIYDPTLLRNTTFLVCVGYIAVLMLFGALAKLFFLGYLRGNAVKLTQNQFPEVFATLNTQSAKLDFKKTPTMYLLQGNGMLNAFAARFLGNNYVIVYSDVLAAAYQEGKPAVEFIIGHELGHIYRNHVSTVKTLLTLPARFIPFLSGAYSRSCEYTCDNIGASLCPEGAVKGLLILSAGPHLYKKVNVIELITTAQEQSGFVTWFAEIFSTHPHTVKRIAQFEHLIDVTTQPEPFVLNIHTAAIKDIENQDII